MHVPRVVVAVPLEATVVDGLRTSEQRVEWVWEPDLLPARRHPADFAGAPGFVRTASRQQAYEDLVDSADILFGLPDTDPAALRRTVLANPRLRWVHTMAAGGGSQVKAAGIPPARLDDLLVTTSAGVHGQPLAEFALLGLLAGAKGLPRLERDRREHHWAQRAPVGQLRGRVVLVLGSGGIGARVAELVTALGARAWGLAHHGSGREAGPEQEAGLGQEARPGPDAGQQASSRREVAFERVLPPAELPAALAGVDAVVAALPGTEATHHLLDAEFLAGLRPGATVVNVGRGSVVDERALVAALATGQVGFAALDVFEIEPLPVDSPLWTSPNVLLSPHTAALAEGEEERIAGLFLDNLRRFLTGAPLRNLMNRDEYY